MKNSLYKIFTIFMALMSCVALHSSENSPKTFDGWIIVVQHSDSEEDDNNALKNEEKSLINTVRQSLIKEKEHNSKNYETKLQEYCDAVKKIDMREFCFVGMKFEKYIIPGENDTCRFYLDDLAKKEALLSIINNFEKEFPINTLVKKIQNFKQLSSPTPQEEAAQENILSQLAGNLNLDEPTQTGNSNSQQLIEKKILQSPIKSMLKRIASEGNLFPKVKKDANKLSKSQDFFEIIPGSLDVTIPRNQHKQKDGCESVVYRKFFYVKNLIRSSLKDLFSCCL